ncbi:PP2C family protein-serine/threonine phosphatase [Streptomyces heilongjiangensis]|uniref:PP2C family protein-serine/threonine phosphatase n=1 Tax=Streptomyces heilongjiangensis TaxID=945052 RepID=UPI002330FA1D|nr:PP2C family protein-serine/threonine phosphatase [Streptomyces heilongjiangensis]MDC2951450.1 PP2C family protein-serine/threonine phosphatase [Streptomyces heilongjiangensis]
MGWALMLAQEDGAHLFPCGISGLSSAWEPPLRPLDRSDSWPACLAALGSAWTGHGFQRPYPLPSATSPAAAAALPLQKSQGTLVVLRPGPRPFSASEETFLSAVAEEVSEALAGLPHPRRADVPRLREVERGAFTLDLTEQRISGDSVFADQHRLPGPGRYPLSAALAALPQADRPGVESLLARLAAEPGTYEVTYRVPKTDGVRTLQARCSRSSDARGQVVLTGHVTDITVDADDADRRESRMHRQMLRVEQMRALASACASVRNTSELAAAAFDVLAVFGADAIVLAEAADERLHILTNHGQQHIEAMRGIALSTSAPLTDALREHRIVFVASHEELIAAYPHYANTAHLLDRQSWAALPIPLSDPDARPAACMLSFERSHAFTAEDHALFIAAAGLLGRALDRCRAWDAEHARAVELQKGLLPAALPSLPDTELTALYLPATAGAYAGGDWYDAFITGNGTLLLAIGDIEGHDTQAASLMGRLRTAIRAYAALTDDPAELLQHTNRLLTEDNDNDPQRARTATCCIAALTSATGRICYATAGHPPPLVHSPRSGLYELPTDSGPPLGIFNDSTYPSLHHRLADDAQLLLHTDGLTDRPGTDPAHARLLLHDAFAQTGTLPADQALNHITTRCLSGGRVEDDCALLLVRRRHTL